jgi:uncharacterized protein YecE (DUF72 family)
LNLDKEQIGKTVAELASSGLLIGTSSWKYQGWRGQLYEDDRYIYRGRFSEKRFDDNSLGEYARVFKTVCVDAAYYSFPTERFIEGLATQVPDDFRFGLKVTDQITIKRFPNLPRFGTEAGKLNRAFLDARLFSECFLGPLERFREKMGLLIFEFSRFSSEEFERGRDFVDALESFLSQLPAGWTYGVEIRNKTFLQPEFFAVLDRHGVAYIYNSWEAMPPLEEQIEIVSSGGNREVIGARLLLRPGRKYEQAVKMFSPYAEIKDACPEGRAAAVKLMRSVLASKGQTRGFVFVNNRFEGNALQTIAAMLNALR